MNTQKEFPYNIYGTADDWGNRTEYYDRSDMLACIESLEDVGFEDISIDDCQEYHLVKVLDGGQAAYNGAWITDGYNTNGRHEIVIFRFGDDRFDRVNSFDPKRDSEEIAELGIA